MIELPKSKYVRPDQVADYFGVSRSTIYTWFDHGHLTGNKLTNGTVRILVSSVRKFEEKGMLKGEGY